MNTSGKELAAEALQKLCAECPCGSSWMPEGHSIGAYLHVLMQGQLTCMSRLAYCDLQDQGMAPPFSQAQLDFHIAFRRARFKLVAADGA